MSNYKKPKYYPDNESEHCPETYGKNIWHTKDQGMLALYEDNRLFLRVRGEIYKQEECSFIDKPFVFNIKDLSVVNDFNIKRISYTGYFQIELNDHSVYVGPKEGKYLSVTSATRYDSTDKLIEPQIVQIYNGEEFMPCQSDQHWMIATRINLKPYLQVGNNTMNLRIYENKEISHAWLEIHASEYCPQVLVGLESEGSSIIIESEI